jgi:riboflavin biosynthesis pyrimidine reductase
VADSPALELLVPGAGSVVDGDDEEGLLALFDDPEPRRLTGAHVRAIMIASLDGAATGPDGRSGSLGDAADRRVFGALRALADVVLVGAGTIRAEGYADVQVPDRLRAVRAARGRPERVELAVVTGRGELPDAVFEARPLVVTTSMAPGLPALRERIGDERVIVADSATPGSVDVAAGLHALVGRGLVHVHAEGGPGLLRELLAAGLVDELCLTLSPLLVADVARHSLVGDLPEPVRLELLHLLRGGDTLLGRWQVA